MKEPFPLNDRVEHSTPHPPCWLDLTRVRRQFLVREAILRVEGLVTLVAGSQCCKRREECGATFLALTLQTRVAEFLVGRNL